jgi:hypothetical protein
MEERVKTFTGMGEKESDWVFVSLLGFAQAQKERVTSSKA